MKKLILILTIVGFASTAHAQDSLMSQHTFNICASILVLGLVMLFILTVMKRLLEHRIKNRIVEKGVPESIAMSILEVSPKEDRNVNLKWALILAGLGIALFFIHHSQPLGIHSLSILAFCLSASFLGYFFISKSSNK
ncbi:hypothetical protein [Runella zeae]|uniref:hypothetical protein n=1 Tax=Runella zeae TaxID=94255 RepID=UPI00041CB1E9|nr:hypothetical protein [Runella zeae]